MRIAPLWSAKAASAGVGVGAFDISAIVCNTLDRTMVDTEPQRIAARHELADALDRAEATGTPIPPLTESLPDLSIADAYAIQAINVARRVDGGRRIVGRKVGLTSTAMQRQLGVDSPDFGALLDDMIVADGDAVDVGTLIAPKVEAEIAFVMGDDLIGPGVDVSAALRAIEGVLPAIEIIDSRVADWKIGLVDTIADNASSARCVLGGRMLPPSALDLRLCGMALRVDGRLAATGAGAAVLGNPARCVAWLANTLGEHGDGLRAGDIVLAGALHAAAPVVAGSSVVAEFAHLGSVGVRFVTSEERA